MALPAQVPWSTTLTEKAKEGFFQLAPIVLAGSPGHCGVSGFSSSSPGGLGTAFGLPSLHQVLELASCFLWELLASWRSLSELRLGLDGKLKSHWRTFQWLSLTAPLAGPRPSLDGSTNL